MSQENFKPGDEVQHKSGGPKMIVTEVGELITCRWFEEIKGVKRTTSDKFQPFELKQYKKPGAGFHTI